MKNRTFIARSSLPVNPSGDEDCPEPSREADLFGGIMAGNFRSGAARDRAREALRAHSLRGYPDSKVALTRRAVDDPEMRAGMDDASMSYMYSRAEPVVRALREMRHLGAVGDNWNTASTESSQMTPLEDCSPLRASQASFAPVGCPLSPSQSVRAGDGRSLGNLRKDPQRNQLRPWSWPPLFGAQQPTSAKRRPPHDPPSSKYGRVRCVGGAGNGLMNPRTEV